jgi:hypothetical protein
VGAKADEYRRQADECDRRANQAKDPEAKRMFKAAAEQWRSMALTAERNGQ